ncbi:SDR family oxidoreductase [Pseudoblastomonas halimionae]|uniref:SDR family oxidoreductase n=1 Tax=Alteriqipengyuania halimionae TaxID=1926630 RepID=A0A6I4U2A4_9SPHN|nr:SDR family oxidoreductase [Alteriqipengyuania halimionae]MXP10140.1 SDR family oxidoreductase [Alteriqipengyuania halimionae]
MKKAIFITGGGSGIGRATAIKFGQEGWFVGLGDVDMDAMRETEKLLPGGYHYSHQFDVRDREGWDKALASFKAAAGGRIDVLFNNAGVPLGGPLAENSTEEVERCIDINLKGVFHGAMATYPYLKESAPGSALINTASAAGIWGTGGAAVYSATKFGVRGMSESLDAEWTPDGIKVAAIMPSFIETPLLDHAPNRGSNESIRGRVKAAGLELTPVEDVAQAVWDAVHGDDLHVVVGKTAKQLRFAARWMPGKLRKRSKKMAGVMGEKA